MRMAKIWEAQVKRISSLVGRIESEIEAAFSFLRSAIVEPGGGLKT